MVVLATAGIVNIPNAVATANPRDKEASSTQDGFAVTITKSESAALGKSFRAQGSKPGPKWQYRSEPDCIMIGGTDDQCAEMQCEEGGQRHRVFRRLVDNGRPVGGPRGQWDNIGTTCHKDLITGNPEPSIEQIQSAFRQITLSTPQLKIQPVGNFTLVNFETYYELTFPAAGVKPNQATKGNVMGFAVEMKPVVHSINYHYGDGSSSGPVSDWGGPYPEGGVRHTYEQPGKVTTRADVTFSGLYRIGGGPWIPIEETVSMRGTPEPLEIGETRNRLVR